MPRSTEKKAGYDLRTACMNVIGFGELLEEPISPKFSQVKVMEFRALLIGNALTLADIVSEHSQTIANLCPNEKASELKAMAQAFKNMVIICDGNNQPEVGKHAIAFGYHILRVITQ